MGRFGARCKLGFDPNPRSITIVTNLGLLGCCYLTSGLLDQALMRSHPNKAVDVVVCQTFSIALGSRAINACLLLGTAFCKKSLLSDSVFFGSARLGRQAATAGSIVADMPWRSGSYTSPLTQRQCSKTASFRATATAALFFAFFPPRSQRRSPYRRKSVSGPNGPKIYCALPTSSLRTIVSPVLLIPNCGWLSPESSCFGTNPRYGPTSRLFTNRCGFSKVST